MTDTSDIDDDENWTGGFYELALELGPPDDARLDQALRSVWHQLPVEGCFKEVTRSPLRHAPAELSLARPDARHLRGVVTLPSGRRIVCGAVAIRLDGGSDWLDFYLPLGALDEMDERIGGFPFDAESGPLSLAWRAPIDGWLRLVAERVYAEAPFRLALIGFEAAAEDDIESLSHAVPSARPWGYLVPTAEGLAYHPANR